MKLFLLLAVMSSVALSNHELIDAVRTHNAAQVRVLLSIQQNINWIQSEEGRRLVGDARGEVLRTLIQMGEIDSNLVPVEGGGTLFIRAALEGRHADVELLMQLGADHAMSARVEGIDGTAYQHLRHRHSRDDQMLDLVREPMNALRAGSGSLNQSQLFDERNPGSPLFFTQGPGPGSFGF